MNWTSGSFSVIFSKEFNYRSRQVNGIVCGNYGIWNNSSGVYLTLVDTGLRLGHGFKTIGEAVKYAELINDKIGLFPTKEIIVKNANYIIDLRKNIDGRY